LAAALKVEYISWAKMGELEELRRLNPLGQVPTLLTPEGKVLTESAAILFYLDDLCPELGLVPREKGWRRTEFFRWLMFLNAAIYPTFA
jgi:GST-like protein